MSTRVLIVEDDEDDFLLIRDLLTQVSARAFELVWQSNYEAGREALLHGAFDVCLLDYRLGEKSGLEFLKEVLAAGCTVPIIFLTGYGDYAVDMETMKAGAADYLTKGEISSGLLERSIRYAIERAESREKLKKARDDLEIRVEERTWELSRANAALCESERKYRELVENANSIILRLDTEGRITFFNEFAQRFFEKRAEEILGRNALGTIFPEADSAGGDLTQAVAGLGAHPERYEHFETRHARRNGERVWIAWTNKAVRNASGAVTEILCVGNDISKRRRAENALRESQRRLSVIVESIADGFYALDRHRRITHVNDAALRYFGKTREEMVGHGIYELFPGFRGSVFETEYLRAMESGEAAHLVARSVVTSKIVEAHAYPGPDNLTILFRDVTEQALMASALRESEERMRFAMESAQLGTLDYSPRTGDMFWNDLTKRLWGIPPEEQPNYAEALERIHPEDRARIRREVQSALESGSSGYFKSEYRIVLPKDTIKWISTRGRVQFDEAGEERSAVRMAGVHVDITQRKRAEEALRNTLAEKVVLLKEVHHRVKNNLQIVASLLGLQANRSKSRDAIDVLEDTRSRVCSMALLHETLYRSENLAHINFATYVGALCGQLLLSFGLTAARVKLEKRVAPIGLSLEQAVPCGLIINELVSNALKHGFPGERTGTIRVELEPAAGSKLVLRIRDDGVGLPSELNPSDTSTLGLKLVTLLTDQLKGRLEVESTEGVGTSFSLVFSVPGETPVEERT